MVVELLLILSVIAIAMSIAAIVTAWLAISRLGECEKNISNLYMRVTMAETVVKRVERRVMDE
jgi:hypothetical protein